VPEYRPPQRTIPARILTPAGWMTGTFHVSRLHSFLDYARQTASFFTLTKVTLPGQKDALPFLALRRSAARVILPSCDESQLMLSPPQGETDEHKVRCMLEAGVLSGMLTLKRRVRVSDFLAHHVGYLMLRDCLLGEARIEAPIAFVSSSAVVAIGDEGRRRAENKAQHG
jgi:hypothetical protein